jgi:hypothetical protein
MAHSQTSEFEKLMTSLATAETHAVTAREYQVAQHICRRRDELSHKNLALEEVTRKTDECAAARDFTGAIDAEKQRSNLNDELSALIQAVRAEFQVLLNNQVPPPTCPSVVVPIAQPQAFGVPPAFPNQTAVESGALNYNQNRQNRRVPLMSNTADPTVVQVLPYGWTPKKIRCFRNVCVTLAACFILYLILEMCGAFPPCVANQSPFYPFFCRPG